MTTEQIVRLAEAYAAHRGLMLSTVSTYAAGDGKWLRGLKERTSGCTLRKAARVVAWFDTHWAPDLQWPRDIPRPSRSNREAA